jgi:hypothetical protein
MTKPATILALVLATLPVASPALATGKACPQTGPNAPLELHKAWILEGWERHEGDPPFVFAKKMDRYYDLANTKGVFYDNFSPNGAPIFDSSIKYGTNWEATVNSSRTIFHALTGHNEQLVSDKVASTTLGFVGDITRLTGERIPFDARSQLGWECTAGEWVIRHEMNYAWVVKPEAIAPFFNRKAK